MAMGALQATMPTLAAAAGLYFFDKLHQNKVPGERSLTHVAGLRAEEIGMVKSNNSTKSPKLAPQFDGLNCFETFLIDPSKGSFEDSATIKASLDLLQSLISCTVAKVGRDVVSEAHALAKSAKEEDDILHATVQSPTFVI